jgi:hypothetical protein
MVKRAVIDRTYSKRINTVGAVYDRASIISQDPLLEGRGGNNFQEIFRFTSGPADVFRNRYRI